MDCCLVSGGDYDGDSFSVSVVKARVEHICVECREVIRVGSKYERYVVFDGGKPEVYKTCVACRAVREYYFCEGWEFGRVWCDMRQALRDMDLPDDDWLYLLPEKFRK